LTFIEVGTLLIAVAAIAGYIPAWKASRIDPMVALRSN
jgi:ABC-type antimicrobial peptide transport system permease subunit